jgi:hypothetical protein
MRAKKGGQLALAPLKVWERMPERPVPYADCLALSQVRSEPIQLRSMQLTRKTRIFNHLPAEIILALH